MATPADAFFEAKSVERRTLVGREGRNSPFHSRFQTEFSRKIIQSKPSFRAENRWATRRVLRKIVRNAAACRHSGAETEVRSFEKIFIFAALTLADLLSIRETSRSLLSIFLLPVQD